MKNRQTTDGERERVAHAVAVPANPNPDQPTGSTLPTAREREVPDKPLPARLSIKGEWQQVKSTPQQGAVSLERLLRAPHGPLLPVPSHLNVAWTPELPLKPHMHTPTPRKTGQLQKPANKWAGIHKWVPQPEPGSARLAPPLPQGLAKM